MPSFLSPLSRAAGGSQAYCALAWEAVWEPDRVRARFLYSPFPVAAKLAFQK